MSTIYYARWLLSPDGGIITNAALALAGDKIEAVGTRSQVPRRPGDRTINLGDQLLLPGLINAHSHLEEGVVRGIPKEDADTFASWIAKKTSRLRNAPVESIMPVIRLGIRESLTNGTTTIVDSSRTGHSVVVLKDEPVRSWIIHEVHNNDQAEKDNLIRTIELLKRVASTSNRVGIGMGPYALFSCTPQRHRNLINTAAKEHAPWASHLAESAEELQAFAEHKGDLYFQITRNREWAYGATGIGPMHYALTENLLPASALLYHCNYVNGAQLSSLAAKNISIVICPQYTKSLGHKNFPLDLALTRGVNICVGTANIPGVGAMNLFDELYTVKTNYPHIPAAEMIRWVTVNPARALGAQDNIGSLAPGLQADFIAVSFAHDPGENLLEELIAEEPEVRLVVVDGEEIIVDY
ncbi:MAG: amidohydrolase family protein [Chitinivibrionales bacterium]|nr:amidohydrolase family protein [Chitinivibrionales bacterium]